MCQAELTTLAAKATQSRSSLGVSFLQGSGERQMSEEKTEHLISSIMN